MICPNCGANLPIDVQVCNYCGAQLPPRGGPRPPQRPPRGQARPYGANTNPPRGSRSPPPDCGWDQQQELADLYARKLGTGFGKGDEERIIGTITDAKGGRPSKYWDLYFTQKRIIFVKTTAPKKRRRKNAGDEDEQSVKERPDDPDALLKLAMDNHDIDYNALEAIDVHGGFGGAKLVILKEGEKLKFKFPKDQYEYVCRLIDSLFPSS